MNLYLSKEILKFLKGKIWFTSKINEGSKFKFEFQDMFKEPEHSIIKSSIHLQNDNSRSEASIAQEDPIINIPSFEESFRKFVNREDSNNFLLNAPKECTCPKVLIVDDDVNNRFVLANYCKKHKISYEEAINGKEALEKVTNFKNNYSCCIMYKIILIDSSMPIMNGEESSYRIRSYFSRNVIRNCPIFCITANSNINEILINKEAIIYDKILFKPIRADTFKNEILCYI